MIGLEEQRAVGTPWTKSGQRQPSDVVWRRGPATLLRYRSAGERAPLPVVLVPSLINRATILDLRPGQSMVEHLVAQGLDVYLVDWGEPGPADAHLDLAGYCARLLPSALKAAREQSGAPAVHLLGYCLGGTMALMTALLRPREVASLLTLTTPVDLSDGGSMAVLTDERLLDLEKLTGAWPIVPGPALWSSFQALDPLGNLRKARRYQEDQDPESRARFEAQEGWLNDPVPMTARAVRDVVALYRRNQLAQGTLVMAGRQLDLGAGRAPLLNLIAQHDTIVPVAAAAALERLWGGEVTSHTFRAGHIGVTVGNRAPQEMWAVATRWLLERQEAPQG